ncbi:Imm1 family immunity protein [Saccharothrix obliqua]|uniref:Imm1 family immunity protein n=1 Tax=Saccharothrix obliqua TaxID=2861747 RepID=UPI001C5DA9F9|nr:Imm1 family immunity protein [Saccharothrix obliqua]MBW4718686.1 hypothetical protein [Saccharothrix obliqua]
MTGHAPLWGEQTGRVFVDVTAYDTPDELIALLLAANPANGSQVGRAWFLRAGTEENLPTLTVGMRGEIGAAEWTDLAAGTRFVPADGLNPDWVDYFLWGGIDQGMPPRAELATERILPIVAEFARTRRKPMCVQWIPEES